MKIREFIEMEVLLPRLKKRDVLVVYDPERRYRELCVQLANDKRRVIDASESSILSREEALLTLQEIGDRGGTIKEMLVYVPAKPPITDEQKQVDPFSIYCACGAVFPEGDGDEFLSLCLKAKPDSATELRRVFSDNPNPSFEVIDAIGGGAGWPVLQATLKVESARNILLALLAPSDLQKESLKNEEGWISEARELLVRCLGLKLKTRGKSWSAIADELWRFVLYSEFVFDLPGDLPPSLKDVPCADEASKQLVNDLCEQLRNDKRTQALYIDKAEAVEEELNLRTACASLTNLGIRDTFLFEERFYFRRALQAHAKNDSEQVHILQQQHRGSVWSGKGESQAQWMLLERALDIVVLQRGNDRFDTGLNFIGFITGTILGQ